MEAYCPACKKSHSFVSYTNGNWLCGYSYIEYSNKDLQLAFLNISKDPDYKEKVTSIPDPTTTAALKFDNEKPRMELLDSYAMEQIAAVMTFGAKKYAAHNWRKGFQWSRLLGAALRHLSAYIGGEDKDPESGLSHLAHLGCCVMFLLWHEKNRPALDDRYKDIK